MNTVRIIIATVFLLFSVSAFAQEAATVKAEGKYSYLEAIGHINKLTDPIKTQLRDNNIELNFFAGVLQGFDNNVNLDPSRKKDGFLETSLNTEAIYNYTDNVRLKVENYTTDILYYNVNSANLLDIYNKAGLEMDAYNDLITFGLDYALDFVIFPGDKDGTYLGNHVKISAKNKINHDLYHQLGYKFLHKSFSHDKTRNLIGAKTDTLRKDMRNGAEYEIGYYFSDRAILKNVIELYYNKGNYEYFDFYDYFSFRVKPSFIFRLNEELYTSGSFTYQQRTYDGRLSSENDEHVYDDTYSFSVSVLYDLTKSFTTAVNYSYRENASNEPLQRYSGSMITLGLYYSF